MDDRRSPEPGGSRQFHVPYESAFTPRYTAAGLSIQPDAPEPVTSQAPPQGVAALVPAAEAELAADVPQQEHDHTLLWYDYETFGPDPAEDVPVQFGAQRTTAGLRDLAEPIIALMAPPEDYLPNPVACIVHGITPQHAARHGLSEQRFARLVRGAMTQPGTVAIGFNNAGFDDRFTDALMARSLLPPLGSPGTRLDLLPMLLAHRALDHDSLAWPVRGDGRNSLRLVDLAAANGVDVGGLAHDALADTGMTLGLARRMRRANPQLWDLLVSRRNPDRVMATLQSRAPAVLFTSGAGRRSGSLRFLWPVSRLAGGSFRCLDLCPEPRDGDGGPAATGPATPDTEAAWVDLDPRGHPMVFSLAEPEMQELARRWGWDTTRLIDSLRQAKHRWPPGSTAPRKPHPANPAPVTATQYIDGELRARAVNAPDSLTPEDRSAWRAAAARRRRRLAEQRGYGHLTDGLTPGSEQYRLMAELEAYARGAATADLLPG